MTKNITQNLNINTNWVHLYNFQKNIDLSFFNHDKYKNDIQSLDKKMSDILCDDSWMGNCAKYQLNSGGKRFRAILALLASQIFGLSKQVSHDIATVSYTHLTLPTKA